MKIYIDDYEPNNLIYKSIKSENLNILNKLKPYLINLYSYIEIYSDNGIFHINKFMSKLCL